ncbi:MAG: spore coat protein [Chloroflexota bacterium]|nr:MAG: spore coat protein [Chloroflexota bacterium]
MKKVIGVIQARVGSTRLPGKVLMEIAGHPMLWHVVTRARRASTLDGVVVATTMSQGDDRLAAFCEAQGIPCFRGSESDVLDRYYQTAYRESAQIVARITADCPLLDPGVIDRVVTHFLTGGFDYVSNTDPPTFPDGLDVEVLTFAALERAWNEARWQSEREHVTPYLRNHPELFRLGNVVNDEDLSDLRWTVDEPEDLEIVRTIYDALGMTEFDMRHVLDLLRRQPRLGTMNASFQRNAGYDKSLGEDRLL